MSKELFKRLERFRRRHKLSILAFCRQLDTSHVNYHRWKNAQEITGPYQKIIKEFLNKKEESNQVSLNKPLETSSQRSSKKRCDIAVIGIACNYPGSSTLKELWENILARRVQFRRIIDQRLPLEDYYDAEAKEETTYLTKAALIDGFEFNWAKWRIPKKTYESTDIVHWLALDTALKAIEDAGYELNNIPLETTGVILGNTLTGEQTRSQTLRLRWPYVKKTLYATLEGFGIGERERERFSQAMERVYKSAFYPITEDSLAGGLANTIAGRICNYFNFKGGGYIVDGACASSLLAVATAANALTRGELDLVLAGGVDISLDPFELVGFAKAGALSKEQMRVYDKRANGFIPGEGCGFIALKRLEDAIRDKDYVYAVIKGWGMSSDGRGGIMEPSSEGQSLAIQRAYKGTDYSIAEVDFIEGHGTGTTRGDKVELEGMASALKKDVSSQTLRRCGVTSFKSIFGHTKAAAGIGGVIKAILAVNQRILPPLANCSEPNEVFEKKARCLYPVIQGNIYPGDKNIKAGVSAAGFGGINCHITLESRDKPLEKLKTEVKERSLLVSNQKTEVFVICSKKIEQIQNLIWKYKNELRFISQAEMADFACWMNKQHNKRAGIKIGIVSDTPEHLYEAFCLIEKELEENPPKQGQIQYIKDSHPHIFIVIGNLVKATRIGYLYPGQGSQALNMTRHLFERYEWARELLNKSTLPLAEHIYKPLDKYITQQERESLKAELSKTQITQPTVVFSSLIWSEYLSKLGIEPCAVGGHSLGEITAFYKAGAFDAGTLLRLAEFRGKLMAAKPNNPCGMVSLFCSLNAAKELVKEVKGEVVIANINSPDQVVVSGAEEGIEEVIKLANKKDISSYVLPVSNAFHSSFMKKAAEEIKKFAGLNRRFQPNNIVLYSCVNGGKMPKDEDLKEYFSRQILSAVHFMSLVKEMSKECDFFIEVGPGRILSDLVKRINRNEGPQCFPVEGKPENDKDLNIVLAELFARDQKINWEELYANRLIKPFIPVSRRKFIVNQCERPLKEIEQYPQKTIDMKTEEQFEQIAVKKGEPETEARPLSIPQAADIKYVTELLRDVTCKMTGFNKESITLDLKLLDDLNLDSIKAGELIAEVTKVLGIAGEIDPSQHSNKQLLQIRDSLYELVIQKQARSDLGEKEDNVLKRYLDKSWVREFVVGYKSEKINIKNNEDLRRFKNVEIICEDNEKPLAGEIKERLEGFKVKTGLYSYQKAALSGECFISILPKPQEGKDLNEHQLRKCIERLERVVKIATQHEGSAEQTERQSKTLENSSDSRESKKEIDSRRKTVVFIQFGNGYHGEQGGVLDITSSCAKSIGSTLHLEWPELNIKIIDFDAKSKDTVIARRVVDELRVKGNFSVVGYDRNMDRKVPVFNNAEYVNYKDRDIQWSKEDVVLVTGGAKGITAQCALKFAREKKVQMILVGRSKISSDKRDEISQTLGEYKKEKLKAQYYSCDITKKEEVEKLVIKVQEKFGKITGIIHGAGLNSVKRLKATNTEEAYKEVRVKVLGAVNLAKALEKNKLKMIAALTSVIGVTGMEGSGWYGFANEVLNLYLRQYKARKKKTEVISLAYSVWDEVGMGVRLGTMKWLSEKGISAIRVEEGVKRFMRLIEKDSGSQQTIIVARIAGIDTWKTQTINVSRKLRFIEDVKFFFPGIELIAQCHINIKDDPYVLDHNWKGSLLWPLVFGLEAMAQAYAYVTGQEPKGQLKFTQIKLERPIPVHPETGARIEIHAQVLERTNKRDNEKVKIDIYSEQTKYSQPHFSAVLEVPQKVDKSKTSPGIKKMGKKDIDVDMSTDIYGRILFQGGMFQCIEKIHDLYYEENARKGQCVFTSAQNKSSQEFLKKSNRFSDFFIGDPFFIDSLFQSMQVIIPQDLSLPDQIEEIELDIMVDSRSGKCIAKSTIDRIDANYYTGNVEAFNKDRSFLKVKSCRLKILEMIIDNPSANDLVDPSLRVQMIIHNKLEELSEKLGFVPPIVRCLCDMRLNKSKREVRHKVEVPLINSVVKELLKRDKKIIKAFDVAWTKSGKPIIKDRKFKNVDISLSHKRNLLICTAGYFVQGCDLEVIGKRTKREWLMLLGKEKYKLTEDLVNKGYDLNVSGTSVWCAGEVEKKIGNKHHKLSLEGYQKALIIFGYKKSNKHSLIIAFPLTNLGFNKAIFSTIIEVRNDIRSTLYNSSNINKHDLIRNYGYNEKNFSIDLEFSGPRGQLVFIKKFPMTFRANQDLSRKVYFTNYFNWMGEVRENATYPIYKDLANLVNMGGWGVVSNSSKLRILGDIQATDTVEARMWVEDVSGDKDEIIDLSFDWRRISEDGFYERVALTELRVTWVNIIGRGVTRVSYLPDFIRTFFEVMKPRRKESRPLDKLPELFSGMHQGERIFSFNEMKGKKVKLQEGTFITSLEDSNLIGNIYFANYAQWLGVVRDTYFYSIAPDYFHGLGEKGEVVSFNTRISYLNEAMPFNTISVVMYLQTVYETGCDLNFEFYSIENNSLAKKLAVANHKVLWMKRHGYSIPKVEKWPREIFESFKSFYDLKDDRPSSS